MKHGKGLIPSLDRRGARSNQKPGSRSKHRKQAVSGHAPLPPRGAGGAARYHECGGPVRSESVGIAMQ